MFRLRLALALVCALVPLLVRANVAALATALDGPGLVWTTGANQWASQTAVTHDGVDAARSAILRSGDAESWVQTTVTGPGVLTWRWRLHLPPGDSASIIELLVGNDSFPRRSLSFPDQWIEDSLVIDTPGSVAVRWRFVRLFDGPPSPAPTDLAYLDTVSYAPFGPLTLQTHTALNARGFTVRWNALANATEYAIELASSANFSDVRAVATVPAPATSFAVTDLDPQTTYHYRVVAYGPEGVSTTSAPASVTTPGITRPANDAFAAAAAIGQASGSIAGTTLDATVQPSEPFSHQASIWYVWTAPTSGRWRFQTSGTGQPILYVYTGTTFAGLDYVSESIPGDSAGVAVVEFDAQAGRAYRIALDAGIDPQGATTLSWQRLVLHAPPANDAFANPALLSGLSGSVTGTNLYATAEAGEPEPATRTVWYRWVAPESGHLTLNTAGSAIATTLSAWSGASLGSLTLLGTDSATPPAASRVTIPVVKNVAYRVSLDGQDGAQGALALAWSLAVPTVAQTITVPPVADQPIDADQVVLSATASSGLPVVFTLVSLSPPGLATLEGDVLAFGGKAGVVTLRANQPGDDTFMPAPAVTFTVTVRAPPANDLVTGAATLTGKSGVFEGDLRYATGSITDPAPARRSVWLRWTAPNNGRLTLDTAGSPTPVALAALTGPNVATLDILDSDFAGTEPARLVLPLTAGTTLWISLDTVAETPGAVRLAWSFADPSIAQTIDFPALPDVGLAAGTIPLEATASSGLPVVFTLVSTSPAGVATLQGDSIVLAGKAGTVTVRANQPGDADHLPAPPVVRSFTVRPPPANDLAANAARLTGPAGSVSGSNIDATTEAIDPAPASRSVWWRWPAPSFGILTVDTAGSAVPVALSVLSGPSPDGLTLLETDAPIEGRGRVSIPVAPGQTYWFVLDTADGQTGALQLAWSLAPPALEQTITFDQDLPDLIVGDQAPVLTPFASSGLPVQIAVVSGPARFENGLLVLGDKAGTITLRATQSGDAFHKPAPPVTRSFQLAALPALTITLGDLQQTYDGTPRAVTATVSPEPRLRPLLVTYNGNPDAPTNAGTYTVVATVDDSRASARLVIQKVPLLVTALDERRLAGEPNPRFRFSYSGFVGNDDASSLARLPVGATPAKITSPGGSYPIRAGGAQSPNYTITYAPGVLTVDSLAARYEAMLLDSVTELPVGKLELAVASSGAAFTGRLDLADLPAAAPLRGRLTPDSDLNIGEASLRLVRGSLVYDLDLRVTLEGGITAELRRNDSVRAVTRSGARLLALAPREKLSWTGAHTALLPPGLAPAADLESEVASPEASGHATAAIDAKGRLKLAGRLADGAPITATLAPDQTGAYRLFSRPYGKRTASLLAGEFPLLAHPDALRFPGRRHLPASAEVRLAWQKAPLPLETAPARRDKSYRAGIAAAPRLVIDPWLPPAARPAPITLLGRLGLEAPAEGANLVLEFGPDTLDLGQSALSLPITGRLAPGGGFTLVSPVTTPANATRFSLKVTPATGVFTGGFTLSDQIAPPPAKPVVRKVAFRGVLRQRPDLAPGAEPEIGAASFLLAPPGVAGAESVAGEIRPLAP
jgi:hypothetical protein